MIIFFFEIDFFQYYLNFMLINLYAKLFYQ